MITAIIIDDDLHFAKILKEEVGKAADRVQMDIEITMAEDPKDCLERLCLYDLYFIDIVMPQLSGIELVKQLREQCVDREFIFVSSYIQYMRESIYVKPRAYIRKEYLEEDLNETFSVLKRIFDDRCAEVSIKDNLSEVTVKPGEIVYMKSDEHYVDLYRADGEKIIVRNTLRRLESQMTRYGFIRIHQRYLVNMNHIEEYSKTSVQMTTGETLPISAPYTNRVFEFVLKREMEARH